MAKQPNRSKPTAPTSGGTNGSGMEQFFTHSKASAGVRLPLTDPLGRPTDHWIHIIGTDSDEFRIKDSAAKRRAVEISAIEDDEERALATMAMTRDLIAHLVKSWSFDKPCTHENVVAFFKEAPQIQRSVDVAGSSRSLFYKVESGSSSNTADTSSD